MGANQSNQSNQRGGFVSKFPPEMNERVYGYLDMPALQTATSSSRRARSFYNDRTRAQSSVNDPKYLALNLKKRAVQKDPHDMGKVWHAFEEIEEKFGDDFWKENGEDIAYKMAMFIAKNNYGSTIFDLVSTDVNERTYELYEDIVNKTDYMNQEGQYSNFLKLEKRFADEDELDREEDDE